MDAKTLQTVYFEACIKWYEDKSGGLAPVDGSESALFGLRDLNDGKGISIDSWNAAGVPQPKDSDLLAYTSDVITKNQQRRQLQREIPVFKLKSFSSAQRDAISSKIAIPAATIFFNTTTNTVQVYANGAWQNLTMTPA